MDEDRPYDAGDPQDVKAAIKESKRWDDKRARVLLGILGSEDGRRWLREVLELCRIGDNPFSKDSLVMSFRCGEINVGNQVMAQLMNASPKLYMRMMQEANAAATPEQKDEV